MISLPDDTLALGLGGNVGGEPAILERFTRARDALAQLGPVRAAPLYRTAPIGPPQPAFLNTVVCVIRERCADATTDRARGHTIRELEHLLGRDRATETRWGPRTIDLDILLWGYASLAPARSRDPAPAPRRPPLRPRSADRSVFGEPDLVIPGTTHTLGELASRVHSQIVALLITKLAFTAAAYGAGRPPPAADLLEGGGAREAGREGVGEDAAVGARDDPVVEDRDDTAIVTPADQPAEALLEGERGGGELERREGIVAELGARLHAGRDQRIGVRRERQLVDHDEAERVAGDIDAFPEGGGAEEDRVGGRAKSIDEGRARCVALDEARIGQVGEAGGGVAHRAVRGEQQEGAATGDREELEGALRGRGGEVLTGGRRQIARHVEQRLARVVERRRDEELVGVVQAEPRAVIAEVGLRESAGLGGGRQAFVAERRGR